MILFSRAFIRRRMISLAATASVAATSFALAQNPANQRHRTVPLQYVTDQPDQSREWAFLSANAAAVRTMTSDMAIKPTGDIDRDFIAMTIPQHQGAVDLAKAELEYGHDEQIRRLAQEIVTEQQHQITVMRGAVAVGGS